MLTFRRWWVRWGPAALVCLYCATLPPGIWWFSSRLPSLNPPAATRADTQTSGEARQKHEDESVWDIPSRTVHDPVALWTCVLTAFTGVLVFVSLRQFKYLRRADQTARIAANAARDAADAAKTQSALAGLQTDTLVKQKEIARFDYLATHRPRLRVRLAPTVHIARDPIRLQFDIVNVGGNDAILTKNEAVLSLWYSDSNQNVLWADQSHIGAKIVGGGALTVAYDISKKFETTFLKTNVRELRLRISLHYIDSRDTLRRTGAYRRFDTKSFSFRRFDPPDPDQEYED